MKNDLKYLVNLRRQLHMYPELGLCEFKTQKLIIKELEKYGIKYKKYKTGVLGFIPGNNKNKVVALRADMDALPITEKNNKKYKSKIKGQMHACGHDSHVTMLLGAARILSKNKPKNSVKLIFQPNEEGITGADFMIECGVLDKPKVDEIFAIHVDPNINSGTIAVKYGVIMAGVDKFSIDIIGTGGHAAIPERATDVIVAASFIIQALQSLISRNTSPVKPTVLSVTKINAGNRFNIMPETLNMGGTVRTLDKETRNKIFKGFKKILDNISNMYGVKYKLDYKRVGEPLINNDRLVGKVINKAEVLFGKNNLKILKSPSMGGEDFASFTNIVPGCFIYLGVRNDKKNITHPWHHSKFDLDENVLPIGAELLANLI